MEGLACWSRVWPASSCKKAYGEDQGFKLQIFRASLKVALKQGDIEACCCRICSIPLLLPLIIYWQFCSSFCISYLGINM